jgi:hypothetical protein
MRTSRDQGALDAPRYYSKAQITQGADRRSVPTRRIGNDGPGLVTTQPGFGARHDQLTPCPPCNHHRSADQGHGGCLVPRRLRNR